MTDSEILRSPTEVLYAVSDKRKIRGDVSDVKSVSASVQTMRSELRQNPPGDKRSRQSKLSCLSFDSIYRLDCLIFTVWLVLYLSNPSYVVGGTIKDLL
jgi:hypothetical protein